MTVSTEGPIRGWLGRWVMRFEAAGQILQLGFQGVTAVSALSGVLALTGREWIVPFVLGAGVILAFAFAYAYVELGIFNRKNRERHDRGSNFAGPKMRIDDELIGAAVFAAVHGRPPDEEEAEHISEAVDRPWQEYRQGVSIE